MAKAACDRNCEGRHEESKCHVPSEPVLIAEVIEARLRPLIGRHNRICMLE